MYNDEGWTHWDYVIQYVWVCYCASYPKYLTQKQAYELEDFIWGEAKK